MNYYRALVHMDIQLDFCVCMKLHMKRKSGNCEGLCPNVKRTIRAIKELKNIKRNKYDAR